MSGGTDAGVPDLGESNRETEVTLACPCTYQSVVENNLDHREGRDERGGARAALAVVMRDCFFMRFKENWVDISSRYQKYEA